MALRRIEESLHHARCMDCSTEVEMGKPIYYDPLAPRGQRARCIPCGEKAVNRPPLAPVSTKEAEELDRLKRKLAELEKAKTEKPATPQPKPSPAPEPVPTPAPVPPNDPLAAAIAKAIEPLIGAKLDREAVRDMIRQYMTPPAHTITVVTPERPEGIDMGRQHVQFEDLMIACSARTKDGMRLNVSLTGSAGTGKTTAMHNVAKALGLEFSATGSLTDTYKLFGFVRPSDGEPIITAFRERWTKGGVFLFDDFDASDPSTAVEANHPLANGHYTFPDGVTLPRHPDCIIGMTMNTWGHGASDDFVGRVKQDKAFLDRFVQIDWQIDEALELDTCTNREWAKYVQSVRAKVKARGIKVLVTPRATYYGEALLAAGMPMEKAKAMAIRKAMTAEQWSAVC